MTEQQQASTTDDWPWGKIIKHILLPKPKDAPPAGNKEKFARFGIAGVFLLLLVSSCSDDGLPACDSSDTLDVAEEVVNGLALTRAAGAKFVKLKDIREEGYNESKEIRACSATLVSTAGENDILYNVSWQNKDKKTFYVELEIL